MQMFQTTNQHGVKFIDEMGYPRTSDMILSGTYMLPRHLNSHSRIYESRDDNPHGLRVASITVRDAWKGERWCKRNVEEVPGIPSRLNLT